MNQSYAQWWYFVRILTLLLLGPVVAHAQAPAWQGLVTPTQAYGENTAFVEGTAADANGNVYMVGTFRGTVKFGTVTLVGGGPTNAKLFVAKWSKSSNSFVWAQAIGGNSGINIYDVAVDGANVFITGSFSQGNVQFGATTLTLTTPSGSALYVAKLVDAGSTASFTWAQQSASSSTGSISAGSIAVAGTNVYLAGSLRGTIDLGGEALSTSTPDDVSSGADTDGFVAKFTDAGTTGSFVWAQQIRGVSTAVIGDVATGRNGLVYICGSFSGQASLGSLSLTSAGDYDGCVAKLTDNGASGSFTWAQRLGGPETDMARALAVSGSAVYVAGSAEQNAEFGSIRLSNQTGEQMFAAKLTDEDATSSFTWVQEAYAECNDIAVKDNNVYLTGRTGYPGYFGTIYSPRSGDIYIAKLKDSGSTSEFTWLQTAQGGSLYAFNLAISGADVYVSGVVSFLSLKFGTLPLITVPKSFIPLSYLAYLTDNTLLASKTAVRSEVSVYPNPAHGTVQIPGANAATVLRLLDNLGRVVRQGSGTTLSILGVAPGLYVLHANTPGQLARTARLVVE
ncbi:T9SS type A sorting domain-containing protein [Hymenobacter metallicola]|uniref:T9SS type A sorting domain-containing protein n=1 Tax=Hymenobacter metallicola TaxID=2563114 RepID=A0A4Z0QDM3_9BACT|nr:T9SS type A sorting domain-containing protein [Hymenobacter metallicola]TGE27101.1 T9SS type A sorting domain-containing protein [Hymenobacter metallicola]